MPFIVEAEEVENTHIEGCVCLEECACLKKNAARLAADLEDVRESAQRLAKRARNAAEDAVEEVTHGIKHHPMRSLGVAFGAGALLGMAVIGRLKPKGS